MTIMIVIGEMMMVMMIIIIIIIIITIIITITTRIMTDSKINNDRKDKRAPVSIE